jgi:methyl-accepting chemotaxis protein
MKNSFFSFSRLEFSPAVGLWLLSLVSLAGAAYDLVFTSSSEVGIALMAVTVVVMLLALRGLSTENKLLGRMDEVLEGASKGILEPRINGIPTASRLTHCAHRTNEVLDQVEAVFRESLTVVSRMGEGHFGRQPQTAGLRGLYPQVLNKIADAQNKVSTTMSNLSQLMVALAQGDFSVRVSADGEKGEYRTILLNAQKATDSLDLLLSDVVKVMDAVARGDLSRRVHADGRGSLEKLKIDTNRSLDVLAQSMASIGENAQQVAGAASDTSTAIGQLADGAQSQTQYIGQMVTAIRQTVNAVGDISTSTDSASRQAQDSAAIVRDGQSKMALMVDVVNGIAVSSEKINKITDVIEKIANKTNLLSLNAAIEAARAGEHGKGFAVVADEVGKLAASSADSTKEITQLIQMAVAQANQAVVAVQEVSVDMERIVKSATQTDGMLQRISAAVEEQTSMMQEINSNVQSLDQIAHSNAAASEELAASMIELSKVADSTRIEIAKFKI